VWRVRGVNAIGKDKQEVGSPRVDNKKKGRDGRKGKVGGFVLLLRVYAKREKRKEKGILPSCNEYVRENMCHFQGRGKEEGKETPPDRYL